MEFCKKYTNFHCITKYGNLSVNASGEDLLVKNTKYNCSLNTYRVQTITNNKLLLPNVYTTSCVICFTYIYFDIYNINVIKHTLPSHIKKSNSPNIHAFMTIKTILTIFFLKTICYVLEGEWLFCTVVDDGPFNCGILLLYG